MNLSGRIIAALLFPVLMVSCSRETIEGLWVVDHVTVGHRELTPLARWVRFNADGTQESGNGWTQHTEGTWDLNRKEQQLSILNSNGLDDPYGTFQISVNEDAMIWTRLEEGDTVKVVLSRAAKLPAAPADQILGLWELKRSVLDETDVTDSVQRNGSQTLFLRWDNRFVLQQGLDSRLTGYFVTDAHRNRLDLIFNGDGQERQRWNFIPGPDSLVMQTETEGRLYRVEYERIHSFPDME